MNIDVATGLPELPEDYFWRIVAATSRYSDGELLVQICTKKIVREDITETRPYPKTWRRLFGPEPTGVEDIKVGEQDVEYITVHVSNQMMDEQICEVDEQLRKLLAESDGWEYATNQSFRGTRRTMVRLWEPTPENVLKAAADALDRLEKNLAEEKIRKDIEDARQAVIGTYPPKKLVS